MSVPTRGAYKVLLEYTREAWNTQKAKIGVAPSCCPNSRRYVPVHTIALPMNINHGADRWTFLEIKAVKKTIERNVNEIA